MFAALNPVTALCLFVRQGDRGELVFSWSFSVFFFFFPFTSGGFDFSFNFFVVVLEAL